MFNPVILVAIILQAIVSRSSRIAGAVLGYVITTGILLWGISLYGDGDQIALFGIPLSAPIFFLACLVWYGFDTREFTAARKQASGTKEDEQLSQDDVIERDIAALRKAKSAPDDKSASQLKYQCSKCGESISEDAKICPHCGDDVSELVCSNCKKPVAVDDKSCPACGTSLAAQDEGKLPESNKARRILAVVLGLVLAGASILFLLAPMSGNEPINLTIMKLVLPILALALFYYGFTGQEPQDLLSGKKQPTASISNNFGSRAKMSTAAKSELTHQQSQSLILPPITKEHLCKNFSEGSLKPSGPGSSQILQAQIDWNKNNYDDASKAYLAAIQEGIQRDWLATAHNSLGQIEIERQDLDGAVNHFIECLAIPEHDPVDVWESAIRLYSIYDEAGRSQEANELKDLAKAANKRGLAVLPVVDHELRALVRESIKSK